MKITVLVRVGQDYSQGLMIGLGVVFMIVPSIFIGLRIWSKALGRRRLSVDDWLCIGALILVIVCSSLQLHASIDGQLGQHQITDENGMPILDDPRFLVYERSKFAVNILGVVGLGLVKASILVFYKSIFTLRAFRWAVYGMLCIVGMWTISYAFANLFTCYPVTALVEPFYGNKCIDAVPMWISVIISDIIVDILIFLMPIPMVMNLQLPLKQRLGVLCMFLLGATVCAISVTRLIVLLQIAVEFVYHYNDMTYYTSPVFFWTNIELSLAVVTACLPTLRPIWTHFRPPKPTTTKAYGSYGSYGSGHMNSGKRSGKGTELYTELDDMELAHNAAEPGVNTRIHASPASRGSERSAEYQGITVHRKLETSSA